MRSRMRFRRRSLASTFGIVAGVAAGIAAATWSTAVAGPSNAGPQAVFDVTHLPPLLTATGDRVDLAYDVHCAPGNTENTDTPCDVRGTVFVRDLGAVSFDALPLEPRVGAGGRQLGVVVPDRLEPARGIEYYAVLEAPALGSRVILPAGGAAAPHVSRPLTNSVSVDLGRHVFGGNRLSGARVAFADWGDRAGQAGLEQGRSLGPIGPSAFDVDRRGNVVLLDQVHRRLLRFDKGSNVSAQVPVSVNGTLADVATAADGSIYVLESTTPASRNPLVRRFDDGGRELEAVESAERMPSQIRIDTRGPVILGRPSHHWMPVLVDGVPASPGKQLEGGRPSRRFGGGTEVVAFRHANEIRIALVAGRTVTRAWRVASRTPLAEVQLAEPWGQRIVVVVRMYEDATDEFVVLVLDRHGLIERFALDSVDWAEASALSRFRLVGRSLYRLGSSPSGVFIDRFDLEVR